MARYWTARVDVDDVAFLHCLLPFATITIGRAENAGVRIPEPWVSGLQAQLHLLRTGDLIVANGTRTRMRVNSRRVWVTAQRGSAVLVEARESAPATLTWPELDGRLAVTLEYGTGDLPCLPGVRDRDVPRVRMSPTSMSRTSMAAGRERIETGLRHRMAVLFQYLLDETDPPKNLYKHASAALGETDTEANLKAATHRLIERVNKSRRGNRIEDVEALGYYLVHTSAAVTEADLAPPSAPEPSVT